MAEGYRAYIPEGLMNAFNAIFEGKFGNLSDMYPMLKTIMEGKDYYCLCWDFNSYVDCQSKVDECYKNKEQWNFRSILSTARCGKFSTDRTINEYASKVWYTLKKDLLL